VRAVDDRAVERWFAQLGWMWTLGESADLIVKPGRLCSNGKPVPIQRADFQKFAQGLRVPGKPRTTRFNPWEAPRIAGDGVQFLRTQEAVPDSDTSTEDGNFRTRRRSVPQCR